MPSLGKDQNLANKQCAIEAYNHTDYQMILFHTMKFWQFEREKRSVFGQTKSQQSMIFMVKPPSCFA